MWRLPAWLLIAILAAGAHWFDSNVLRIACAFAFLALLALSAPAALRPALAIVATLALLVLAAGGVARLLDALPALIAGFVAWLFARTLYAGRRPLIARAIAALDGEAQLDDPHTATYARRLTCLWAVYQSILALIATALAVYAASAADAVLLGPRLFGAVVLPLAVASLLLAEFALRPWLLPRAPRHRLDVFVRNLVRAWPTLLGD
jgi:uncharacterized membrane protein